MHPSRSPLNPWRPVRVVFAVLAAVAVLTGCTTVGSSAVETSAVEPRIRVVVDESGSARISVALLAGFANALELEAGDALTARLETGTPIELTEGASEVFGASTAYFATLSGAMPGDAIVLAWSRAGQVSAPNTRIVVPEAVRGVSTGGTEFGFDDDVPVAWTPEAPGDAVDARLRLVACDALDADELAAARFLAGFPATFPIEDGAGTFEPVLATGASTACSAVLEVGRSSSTIDLDPAFGGLRDRSSVVQLGAEVAVVFAEP